MVIDRTARTSIRQWQQILTMRFHCRSPAAETYRYARSGFLSAFDVVILRTPQGSDLCHAPVNFDDGSLKDPSSWIHRLSTFITPLPQTPDLRLSTLIGPASATHSFQARISCAMIHEHPHTCASPSTLSRPYHSSGQATKASFKVFISR